MVLNAKKAMLFLIEIRGPAVFLFLVFAQGISIKTLTSHKYLGIVTDDNLSSRPHLLKKLGVKLGFFFQNGLCFSFTAT